MTEPLGGCSGSFCSLILWVKQAGLGQVLPQLFLPLQLVVLQSWGAKLPMKWHCWKRRQVGKNRLRTCQKLLRLCQRVRC